MAHKYKTGDNVMLKSGGPSMTVTRYNSDDWVATQWFSGKKLEHGSFPEESLIPVSADAR